MNSTPSRPTCTMRLTALLPPPPTPTTLIRAPARVSSASFKRNELPRSSDIRGLPSEKFLEQPAQPPGHASESADTDHAAAGFAHVIPLRVEHETDGRRKFRIAHMVGQAAHAGRQSAPDRQIEYLFRD